MKVSHKKSRQFVFVLWLAIALPALAQVDSSTYPLGANIVPVADGGGVVFRLWAPNATSVHVAGDFNGWNNTTAPLALDVATGIWSGHVPSAAKGQEYKFFLAPTGWKVDPRARQVRGNFSNGVILDDGADFAWSADDWIIPDHDKMIIYELHLGVFSGGGDGVSTYPAGYRDVVDAHLDHLLALNVNMVEIMPIHEFPGNRSWGYNPVHLYAPEGTYGSPDDLRYMVDTLHANGIGVILDVVYNHFSSSDNNLWQFDGPENIYYFGNNCMGDTPWGPRPDYTRPEVRDFITDNARYWIEEFRIDGLRVDATQFMRGYCNEQGEGWLVMQDVAEAARAANPRVIVTAEELPNTGAVTTPRNEGGAGYDAQWADAFHDVLRENMYNVGQGASANVSQIASVIPGSGFGRPALEAIKFSENHDESGNVERVITLIDPLDPLSEKSRGLTKVIGGLAMVSPGIPMLFMGQEFHVTRQFHDGIEDRIPWAQAVTYAGTVDYYGALGRFRRERPSLWGAAPVNVYHVNEGADVIAFHRTDGSGDDTIVVANLGASHFTEYLLGAPIVGEWFELANGDDLLFGGDGRVNQVKIASDDDRDGFTATLNLELAPYTLFILSTEAPASGLNSGLILR